MKLEDEILNILSDTLYIGRDTETEVPVIQGESNASRRLKELIERYCKRQRELCKESWAEEREHIIQFGPERDAILYAKLATEE